MHARTGEDRSVSADPLLSHAEFTQQRRYYPLGFALDIATNSDLVLQAAERSWAGWSQRFDNAPFRIEVGVGVPTSEDAAASPVFRSRDHLLSIISDPANFMVCDMQSGFAFGWVTPGTAANQSFFRYFFLDVTALTLVEQRYLAPVHGALVARNGVGVLLCGDTGAGKSTLALACALAGWDYVSDDATNLIRDRDDLFAIGNCHVVRLRADAAQLFREIAPHIPVLRANGKSGFELFTLDIPGMRTAESAAIHHVVFLERSSTARLDLRPISDKAAGPSMQRQVRYGTAETIRAQSSTYGRLSQAYWWTLSYADFTDAVALLDTLVRS
jgi:hypothetical protein